MNIIQFLTKGSILYKNFSIDQKDKRGCAYLYTQNILLKLKNITRYIWIFFLNAIEQIVDKLISKEKLSHLYTFLITFLNNKDNHH